jgi:E-phenylitaconyl-CoA hydratase
MPPEAAGGVGSEVVVRTDGPVAHVTLNRPSAANAIDRATATQLRQAWIAVRDDPAVRAIVVTGAGVRHFCAGVDLKFVAASGEVPSKGRMSDPEPPWTPMANEVWKPVICVVNGVAAGGGLHLVAEADVVIAEPSASFLDSHVNVGMVGAIENIQLLDRLPLGIVMMMTLAGRGYRLTAQRAYELGLVDVLAPQGGAMAEADRLAALIAQNSPSAVTASKRAIWHAVRRGQAERLSLGWQLLQQQWEHPDFAEGPAAFAEGRAPVWAEPTEPGRST